MLKIPVSIQPPDDLCHLEFSNAGQVVDCACLIPDQRTCALLEHCSRTLRQHSSEDAWHLTTPEWWHMTLAYGSNFPRLPGFKNQHAPTVLLDRIEITETSIRLSASDSRAIATLVRRLGLELRMEYGITLAYAARILLPVEIQDMAQPLESLVRSRPLPFAASCYVQRNFPCNEPFAFAERQLVQF